MASASVVSLPGPNCLVKDLSHETMLVGYTAAPLLLLTFLSLPSLVFIGAHYVRARSISSSALDLALNTILKPALFLLFFAYPITSQATLSNFSCQDVGVGSFLMSNYKLRSARWLQSCKVVQPPSLRDIR